VRATGPVAAFIVCKKGGEMSRPIVVSYFIALQFA
jgi:hypothetical protein